MNSEMTPLQVTLMCLGIWLVVWLVSSWERRQR
jgi:hypothetical protein